jgi:hypothetical protein
MCLSSSICAGASGASRNASAAVARFSLEERDRALQMRTFSHAGAAAAAFAVDLFETDNLAHRGFLGPIIIDPDTMRHHAVERLADDALDFVPPCGYQNRACTRAPR